jgi:hypothetical protein
LFGIHVAALKQGVFLVSESIAKKEISYRERSSQKIINNGVDF